MPFHLAVEVHRVNPTMDQPFVNQSLSLFGILRPIFDARPAAAQAFAAHVSQLFRVPAEPSHLAKRPRWYFSLRLHH